MSNPKRICGNCSFSIVDSEFNSMYGNSYRCTKCVRRDSGVVGYKPITESYHCDAHRFGWEQSRISKVEVWAIAISLALVGYSLVVLVLR